MPHNARFLYQQPKIEINNYLIVNWFSLPLQFVKKHLVLLLKSTILWFEVNFVCCYNLVFLLVIFLFYSFLFLCIFVLLMTNRNFEAEIRKVNRVSIYSFQCLFI